MTKKELEEKVKELERENEFLRKECNSAYDTINEMKGSRDDAFLQSPAYRQIKDENERLSKNIEFLERRLSRATKKNDQQVALLEQLQQQIEQMAAPVHNARGAGRKKADEKWVEGFGSFIRCYESQKSITETMQELGISRATYYRYKKLYNETNTSDD